MVTDDRDSGPLPSFSGLKGEERFHTWITRSVAGAGTSSQWLDDLRPVLWQLVHYDAAWLGRWDAVSDRYLPLLEDGNFKPLRELFASDLAAVDIEQLGFRRPGWPLLGHRILPRLGQLPGWNRYLAPAGFHDGIGVGLRTSDGRHVGYLTLLTYRPNRVPATAAALLHSVNSRIGDAIDRDSRSPS